MRATRDLLRRRLHFSRKRSELLAHIQNTNSQYNLPAFEKQLTYRSNRSGVVERFADPSVQKTIEVDLALLAYYDQMLRGYEVRLRKPSSSLPTEDHVAVDAFTGDAPLKG